MSDEDLQISDLQRIKIDHAQREHDRVLQTVNDARKFAIDAANVAVRSLILINGGAVVTLLAFVGSILKQSSGSNVHASQVIFPILAFAVGVGFSACALAAAYFVSMLDGGIAGNIELSWQHPYVREKTTGGYMVILRKFFFFAGITLALLALASFFVGVISVTDAIARLGI